MKKHTKCHMNEICKIPHRDGECERNCYYNTIEVKTNADCIRVMSDEELAYFMANIEPCRESAWLDWLRQKGE